MIFTQFFCHIKIIKCIYYILMEEQGVLKQNILLSFKVVVNALHAISKSGKGVMPTLKNSSDCWVNTLCLEEYIRNALTGNKNDLLPGKAQQLYNVFVINIEAGYESGVFDMKDSNTILNAIQLLSRFFTNQINEHSKQEKSNIDKRDLEKQKKIDEAREILLKKAKANVSTTIVKKLQEEARNTTTQTAAVSADDNIDIESATIIGN